MIDKKFVAKSVYFKPASSETSYDDDVVVEVVEESKGQVEIAFTLANARHYLTFNLAELLNATKEFKAARSKR